MNNCDEVKLYNIYVREKPFLKEAFETDFLDEVEGKGSELQATARLQLAALALDDTIDPDKLVLAGEQLPELIQLLDEHQDDYVKVDYVKVEYMEQGGWYLADAMAGEPSDEEYKVIPF